MGELGRWRNGAAGRVPPPIPSLLSLLFHPPTDPTTANTDAIASCEDYTYHRPAGPMRFRCGRVPERIPPNRR
jgi:hypothetical protein